MIYIIYIYCMYCNYIYIYYDLLYILHNIYIYGMSHIISVIIGIRCGISAKVGRLPCTGHVFHSFGCLRQPWTTSSTRSVKMMMDDQCENLLFFPRCSMFLWFSMVFFWVAIYFSRFFGLLYVALYSHVRRSLVDCDRDTTNNASG